MSLPSLRSIMSVFKRSIHGPDAALSDLETPKGTRPVKSFPAERRRRQRSPDPQPQARGELGDEKVVEEPKDISFVWSFNQVSKKIRSRASEKGWVDPGAKRDEGELLAQMHAELAEALEGLCHGNPPSDRIPEFSRAEETLADIIIGIMGHAQERGYRVSEALIAKMVYNKMRQ